MDLETLMGAIASFDFQTLAEALTFETALATIVLLIISAFFALRLYKIYISAAGAVAFGFGGYYIVAELMDVGTIPTIEGINLHIVAGFAAALIGFILAALLNKVVLFVVGAAAGFVVADMFLLPLISGFFPIEGDANLIVAGVIALIVGALVCALFKPIYILVTSVGGMAIVGGVVVLLAMPYNLTVFIIGLVVGAVVGIIPTIYQFKASANEA